MARKTIAPGAEALPASPDIADGPAPALRITARRDGFRRAGLAHPGRPVEHPAGRFDVRQLAQLLGEPMLVVEVVVTE